MGGPKWLTTEGSAFRLSLLIQAGAKKNAVLGEYQGRLKLKIAAPPVDGAANDALIAFLAEILGLRKNQVQIIFGEYAKYKLVEVRGQGAACSVATILEALQQLKV